MSLQFQCKAKIIKTKMTQNNLCKQLGIGVSSLSRWLNGLTAKMNPAYLVQMNEIMSAWLEDRERNVGVKLECWPGKGRKQCPSCKSIIRSNTLRCKKCSHSFETKEREKQSQSAIVWPKELQRARNASARKSASMRRTTPIKRAADDSIPPQAKKRRKTASVKNKTGTNAATAEAEPEEAPLEDTVEDTDDDDSELEV